MIEVPWKHNQYLKNLPGENHLFLKGWVKPN